MNYKNIALTIAKEINVKYPNINIYYTFYNDISEIFIIIDNKEVYDSQEYINLVYDISDRYINNNVFFSYVMQDEQMPKNAINLTFENMKKSLNNISFDVSFENKYAILLDLNTNRIKKSIVPYKKNKLKSIIEKYLLYKSGSHNKYNYEADKQIVPNGMLKPFFGFGAIPTLKENSCQINNKAA